MRILVVATMLAASSTALGGCSDGSMPARNREAAVKSVSVLLDDQWYDQARLDELVAGGLLSRTSVEPRECYRIGREGGFCVSRLEREREISGGLSALESPTEACLAALSLWKKLKVRSREPFVVDDCVSDIERGGVYARRGIDEGVTVLPGRGGGFAAMFSLTVVPKSRIEPASEER